MIKIVFLGDITLGGVMEFTGGVDSSVKRYLDSFDIRIANLETCFGKGYEFCKIKMNDSRMGNIIYCPDECVSLLKELKIDVVSLANNHSCDCGIEGMLHTMDVLNDNGIAYVGAGRNRQEAESPVVKYVNGKSISIYAYNDIAWAPYTATDSLPGLNTYHINKILFKIKEATKKYDYTFILPHWGVEHTIWPSISNVTDAYQMIKSGAAGVIGSHTHMVQPYFRYKEGVIAMSLGNSIFPDRYINHPRITVYPSATERKCAIPVTEDYPFVDRLTYKRIPMASRIGCCLSVSCNDTGRGKVKFHTQYTRLTNEHILRLADISWTNRIKMKIIGMALRDDTLRVYNIIHRFRRGKHFLVTLPKRIVHKIGL